MKILNLYSGVGGNRRFWGDEHDIVAVELDPEIADTYRKLYPADEVVIGDAHEYLLKNFHGFDFIWTSPPCQSHSQFRQNLNVKLGRSEPRYPDMKLYEEIIFLKHNCKTRWVVENVKPYYEPLIKENYVLDRHLFWCNFKISPFVAEKSPINMIKRAKVTDLEKKHQISLGSFDIKNKRQILRNCVNPDLGLHILKEATLP